MTASRSCVGCGRVNERAGSRYCARCAYRIRVFSMMAWRATRAALEGTERADPARFRCSTCEQRAECYWLRTFTRPSDVEPTCRACRPARGYPQDTNLLLADFARTGGNPLRAFAWSRQSRAAAHRSMNLPCATRRTVYRGLEYLWAVLPEEFAALHGVAEITVRRWLRAGLLVSPSGVRPVREGRWLIPWDAPAPAAETGRPRIGTPRRIWVDRTPAEIQAVLTAATLREWARSENPLPVGAKPRNWLAPDQD